MFRIFRKPREQSLSDKKTKRYLLYAAGEVALIIIGILIALQINNWNEERIELNEIREYALDLSAAIEQDLEMLAPVEMQIRASIRQAQVLSDYIRERDVEELDNAEMFFMTTHIGYRPYNWNRAALDQLKAAGGLRRIKNKQLTERISDYDALSRHLDQDYIEDENAAKDILDSVNHLIDVNYDRAGLEDLLTWDDGFTTEDIERRLTQFRETELFESLSALNKPLLSEDTAEFRRFANINREYADSVRWRPESEIPRLRGFAQEILDLIDETYR